METVSATDGTAFSIEDLFAASVCNGGPTLLPHPPPPPPPERNLMVTELIKTVESFHPAKKMKNLFNICYVLQKHFESRLCYKLIKKIKNIKKKFLRILKKILKTSKKCKSFESSRNNIIKIISKLEIIFALYSMSFVFHLYSFYCVLCCT